MLALTLTGFTFTPGELAEIVAVYRTNPVYFRAAGDYDPDHILASEVEADLRDEVGTAGSEVLIARDESGEAVGVLCLLDRHPTDGHPWIGLLLVHGARHRQGLGRRLAALVEERYRAAGREGLRLAVLENNPSALAFWSALGWQEIDRRADIAHARPSIVMHKALG
ncbi:ribosomal protein S18 acetylase RimI-like enzyme [Catenulispora sp. GP43]|uniref:GNAT family N-acetyltransferase n=1 Tax=Catenulispora sp. GP43 TaxID=3156263 RepID=UPI0035175B4F